MAVRLSSPSWKESSEEASLSRLKWKKFLLVCALVVVFVTTLCWHQYRMFAPYAKTFIAAAVAAEGKEDVNSMIMRGPTEQMKTIQQNMTKATEYAISSPHSSQALQELQAWRRKRVKKDVYDSFFNADHSKLLPEADRSGPILDFAIAGFPKCGTTGMMRTLAAVATMPVGDICTPAKNAIYYSYVNWANEFGNGAYNYTEDKPLKGSKCPYWLENDMDDFGKMLPKTNLIVGIRHPVLFFQSFSNQWYHRKKDITLEDFVNRNKIQSDMPNNHKCNKEQKVVCVARSRFHLSLARLGKTLLGTDERHLLAAELHQSNRRFNDTSTELRNFPIPENINSSNFGVPNNVFLFDSSQGKEEYLYKELAEFVRIDRDQLPPLDKNTYHTRWSGNGSKNQTHAKTGKTTFVFDICLPQYEHVRKELLPISYTLGRWLLDYFIPASYQRSDITIPNVTAFSEIVQGYLTDPCNNTLVRNKVNGEYY